MKIKNSHYQLLEYVQQNEGDQIYSEEPYRSLALDLINCGYVRGGVDSSLREPVIDCISSEGVRTLKYRRFPLNLLNVASPVAKWIWSNVRSVAVMVLAALITGFAGSLAFTSLIELMFSELFK